MRLDEHEGSSFVACASIFKSATRRFNTLRGWLLLPATPVPAAGGAQDKHPRRSCASPCVASSAEAANAFSTTHCPTRYAYSRRSHVVLKTISLKSAVSEAEFSKFHAYSFKAAHSTYRAGEQTRFSRLPRSRATQGYRQRNNDPPRDCMCVAQKRSDLSVGSWKVVPTDSNCVTTITFCACTSPAHLQGTAPSTR